MHQTVKPAVPGSNPASLQPAGTCHSLLGSQQDWHETAGWPLRGGRCKKIPKKQESNMKKIILQCRYVNISEALPQTTSVKLVEVWMLFSLLQPFCDVLLQTYVHYLRGLLAKAKQKVPDCSGTKPAPGW